MILHFCLFFHSTTLEQHAPWRYFQEEKERQKRVTTMIEEIYDDLKNEVKQGNHLNLSKSDMTVLFERKLGELPSSNDVEDMWMYQSSEWAGPRPAQPNTWADFFQKEKPWDYLG